MRSSVSDCIYTVKRFQQKLSDPSFKVTEFFDRLQEADKANSVSTLVGLSFT
jgi:hypothetical protein